jgi:hypothetical protein
MTGIKLPLFTKAEGYTCDVDERQGSIWRVLSRLMPELPRSCETDHSSRRRRTSKR